MKKLLVAITAALGLASAAVPASAGGSISVSGSFYSAPVYSHSYHAPVYSYVAPVQTYVAPRYYAPAPVVTFSFGKSYHKPYRAKRHHRRAHRKHYRGHRGHHRGHRNHW